MPVLKSAQVATLQRVLATANNVLPALEMLEGVARINTSLTSRVSELRAQREYLVQLATATLEIERQLGGQVAVPPVQSTAGVNYGQPAPQVYPQGPPPPAYVPPPPPPLPDASASPYLSMPVESWVERFSLGYNQPSNTVIERVYQNGYAIEMDSSGQRWAYRANR